MKSFREFLPPRSIFPTGAPSCGQIRARFRACSFSRPDHVQPLPPSPPRRTARPTLDIANLDEALDDRRGALAGRTDSRVLHRLAQRSSVVHQLPGPSPSPEQRRIRCSAAAASFPLALALPIRFVWTCSPSSKPRQAAGRRPSSSSPLGPRPRWPTFVVHPPASRARAAGLAACAETRNRRPFSVLPGPPPSSPRACSRTTASGWKHREGKRRATMS